MRLLLRMILSSVYLLCCSLFLLPLAVHAQSADWSKTHGSQTGGYAVQRLDDGGFIAIGSGGDWLDFRGYLIRTYDQGNKIWDKQISVSNVPVWFNAVKKTPDGGFAVGGSRNNIPLLWKFKANGDEDWSRQLMGPDSYGDARGLVVVTDGIVTTGGNSIAGKYKLFVHKFSFTADSLWSRQSTFKQSIGIGIRQALDGGFVITGSADEGSGYQAHLLKLSSAGAFEWKKNYPMVAGSNGDEGHDIAVQDLSG